MKPKYIVGIVAALALMAVAVWSVENRKIEYMDFLVADHRTLLAAGGVVAAIGIVVGAVAPGEMAGAPMCAVHLRVRVPGHEGVGLPPFRMAIGGYQRSPWWLLRLHPTNYLMPRLLATAASTSSR